MIVNSDIISIIYAYLLGNSEIEYNIYGTLISFTIEGDNS